MPTPTLERVLKERVAGLVGADLELVETEIRRELGSPVALIQEMGYRLWWHKPPLFNPANFAGNQDNVFPRVVSLNKPPPPPLRVRGRRQSAHRRRSRKSETDAR